MEKKHAFILLQEASHIPQSLLFWGDFDKNKTQLFSLFKEKGIDLAKPGHYIMQGGVFNMDSARDLARFYNTQVKDDAGYSVMVLAPDTFKIDAQQILLKLIEESRENCFWVLFLHQESTVLPTIQSRVVQYVLENDAIKNFDDIRAFMSSSPAKRAEKITKDTKNLEGPEIRIYTQTLVRDLCDYFYTQGIETNKDILALLLEAQKSLSYSRTAPKFILDYIAVIL